MNTIERRLSRIERRNRAARRESEERRPLSDEEAATILAILAEALGTDGLCAFLEQRGVDATGV